MTGARRAPRNCAAALTLVSGLGAWLMGCSHPVQSTDDTATAATTSAVSPPTSTLSAAEARTRLLKSVPAGYPANSCTSGTALGGAVAEVSCGKNGDSGGPPSATYSLFADAGTLRLSFENTLATTAVTDCPGRIQSPGAWHRAASPDKPSGMLLCGARQSWPVLVWTNDESLLLSVAHADHNGPTLDQLYSWWSSHS